MSSAWVTVAVSLVTGLMTAAGAFWGVRVALARVEERINSLAQIVQQLQERVARLEAPFFNRDR